MQQRKQKMSRPSTNVFFCFHSTNFRCRMAHVEECEYSLLLGMPHELEEREGLDNWLSKKKTLFTSYQTRSFIACTKQNLSPTIPKKKNNITRNIKNRIAPKRWHSTSGISFFLLSWNVEPFDFLRNSFFWQNILKLLRLKNEKYL